MKLSFKIILPIILISALLILLAGCFGVPADEEPGYTPGTITGIIASPCCTTSAELVSETSGSPEYWCYYCQKEWKLQDGIKVVLTYGEDEVATAYTNEDGEFTFTNVDPGKNYVVTAYCPDFDDNRPLVKDVALEVIEGGSFDTKITDLVSTSLGLVVDFLVVYTDWGPEDISLDAVLADRPSFPNFPKFKKLVYEVRRVVENCELNLLTDDDVQYALCLAAEEISKLDIGCAPGFTPLPGPGPTPPGECVGDEPPSITDVTKDGVSIFKEDPALVDDIHLTAGTPYVFCVTATDDDNILPSPPHDLIYYLTIDGVDYYSIGNINCLTITPEAGDVDNNPHEVFVNVYDGCLTKTWGPVTVVVECPLPTDVDAGSSFNETVECPDDDVIVTFSGSASGTGTLTYDWDFGDGSTHGTGSNPSHTYEYPFTNSPYTVTLTVTGDGENECGSDTDTTTVTIDYVPCCPPPTSLDIVISSTNPPCDETFAYINSVTVSFDGKADETITPTYVGTGVVLSCTDTTNISIDQVTGEVELTTGAFDTYTITVTYTDPECGDPISDTVNVTFAECPPCPPPTSLDIVISSTNPPCDETFAYINSVTVSFDGKADETITPTYVGTGVVLSCTDTTNISIDQVTGEVELTTGAFDTYTITVTYTDPECGDPINDTVQVTFAECECGYCYSEDGNGCFTIESEASYDGTNTTFWFKICDLDGSDCAGLSHWVYGTETSAEFCIDASDIVSISPGYSSIGYDGSTGKYGIKWESSLPGDGECKEFTIVLKGCRVGDSGGDYMAILKYGNFYTTFDVCGPTCD